MSTIDIRGLIARLENDEKVRRRNTDGYTFEHEYQKSFSLVDDYDVVVKKNVDTNLMRRYLYCDRCHTKYFPKCPFCGHQFDSKAFTPTVYADFTIDIKGGISALVECKSTTKDKFNLQNIQVHQLRTAKLMRSIGRPYHFAINKRSTKRHFKLYIVTIDELAWIYSMTKNMLIPFELFDKYCMSLRRMPGMMWDVRPQIERIIVEYKYNIGQVESYFKGDCRPCHDTTKNKT